MMHSYIWYHFVLCVPVNRSRDWHYTHELSLIRRGCYIVSMPSSPNVSFGYKSSSSLAMLCLQVVLLSYRIRFRPFWNGSHLLQSRKSEVSLEWLDITANSSRTSPR